MEKEELENMFYFEDTYWWFVGRNYTISNLFKTYKFSPEKNKILNVGCGTGGLYKFLSHYPGSYYGMDISDDALFFSKKRNINLLCKGNILNIPFKNESFTAIFALDIIEHLDNDIIALHELRRVLKKNGFCFFSVPAFSFLWSEHDVILGHKRRYRLQELEKKIKNSNYFILKKGYFVSFVFPIAFIYRLLTKKKHTKKKKINYKIPKSVNQILFLIMKVESILVKKLRLPFGLSIFCITKK